jgi:putative transposase
VAVPPVRRESAQPWALSAAERAHVLEVLNCGRFADMAPAAVYATLLDEGVYLCSESTMYRLLRERNQTGDRRRHATHPAAVKAELVAYQPNSAWSWDITKLHGPAKWTYYYLYVILDIFSHYVVGWSAAGFFRMRDTELYRQLLGLEAPWKMRGTPLLGPGTDRQH